MKRAFIFLAVILGMVSCQNNAADFDVNVSGVEEVTINVSLPEETRADSALGFDLSTLAADSEHQLRYILEIYPEGGSKVYRDVKYSNSTSASFPVSIIAGRKYTFAVWADIVEEVANRTDDADADLFYETSNGLKNISIIADKWNAMDEKRDAFTGYATLQTGNLSEVNSITLTRPFAKLRAVATDITKLTDLGLEPKVVKVTYAQQMYTQFDATTATASVATTKSHTINTFPYTDAAGEKTLFADYIFVPENSIAKFNIEVYSDEACTSLLKELSFSTNIFVERNKLTSIKGDFFTNNGNFDVNIDSNIGSGNEYPTEAPSLGIYDTNVDPSKYLVYVANQTRKIGWPNSDDYNLWETYFDHTANNFAVAEYKFQLPSEVDEELPISDDDITINGKNKEITIYNGYYYNDDDDRKYMWTKIDLSTIGVNPTDVITLRVDNTNNIVTINGNKLYVPIDHAMSKYIFSTYYSESDEGHYSSWTGMGDGTKLFYAKGWDDEGRLKYLGYASTDTNTETGNVEACWKSEYYANNQIFKKSTFANSMYLTGTYVPLGMGNLQ